VARVTPQSFRFPGRSALLRLPCLHEQHRRLLQDFVGDVGIMSRRLLVMIDHRSLPKLVRTAKEHRGDIVTEHTPNSFVRWGETETWRRIALNDPIWSRHLPMF
jgi:hypothetical protein